MSGYLFIIFFIQRQRSGDAPLVARTQQRIVGVVSLLLRIFFIVVKAYPEFGDKISG